MDAGIKAIFTSGYTADIIQRRGQLAAGINFISKPAVPAELLAKVREALDGASLAGETNEAA
jgi:polar amino acid transport system substrate-binding protein